MINDRSDNFANPPSQPEPDETAGPAPATDEGAARDAVQRFWNMGWALSRWEEASTRPRPDQQEVSYYKELVGFLLGVHDRPMMQPPPSIIKRVEAQRQLGKMIAAEIKATAGRTGTVGTD